MRIIAKYLCKNIASKPLRTLLLLVCIMCFSFVTILSLDMTGALKPLVKSMMSQITGTSDILISSAIGVEEPYDLEAEADQLLLYEAQNSFIRVEESLYTYFHKEVYHIMNCDYELAYQMRLLDEKLQLSDDEVAVTPLFAKTNQYQVGDLVEIYDESGESHCYTIAGITAQRGIANGRTAVFVNAKQFEELTSVRKATLLYIDVAEDGQILQAKETIDRIDHNITMQVLTEDEDMQEMIVSVAAIFAMVFAVCFLLVIFVTISVTGRIIQERMSVVGTFRSFGCSPAFVTKLLLAENALYGILGGAIGVLLYKLCREPFFHSVYNVSTTGGMEVTMEVGTLNPLYVGVTIVFVMIVECCLPLREVLKASKRSIRDIIFDNRDTAYRMNRYTVMVGAIGLVIAILLFLVKGNVFVSILAFVLIIVAVSMLFPCILKGITSLLLKLGENSSPIVRLAFKECIARKSTVGSAVLCVTASSLAIIIYILVTSVGSLYAVETYHADIILQTGYQEKPEQFAYIKDLEGVEAVENIYTDYNKIEINGIQKEVNVFGQGEDGFRMLTGIKELPQSIADNQVYMDKSLCDKFGVQIGENITVRFNLDTFLPTQKSFRVAGYIDSYHYDTASQSMVISQSAYIDIFHDYPTQILVKCENTEAVRAQIAKYSATKLEGIQTLQEYQEEWLQKGEQMKGMLMAVIVLGIGLTVIGIVSNQLIGFQGRKRECAVLLSISMTKGKLALMLVLETAVSSGIALLTALPTALLAGYPLKKAVDYLAGEIPIVIDIKSYISFLIILWLVFTAVSFFPVKELKKMQIAAQLKYE